MSDDFKRIKELVNYQDEVKRRTGIGVKNVFGKEHFLEKGIFCNHHDCCSIDTEQQVALCRSCGFSGSVIDFVMRLNGCSEYEALLDIAEANGIQLSQSGKPKETDPRQAIRTAAMNILHNNLLRDQKALKYQLETRGHSLEAIKEFKVGYSTGNLVPELLKQGFSENDIVNAGLGRDKDGSIVNKFHPGYFVHPVKNKPGEVVNFRLKPVKKSEDTPPYQLNQKFQGPGGIFANMPAFKSYTVIVTEGYDDMITVFDKGKSPAVAATCGQLTKEHVAYIRKWANSGKSRTLYLCFDNDPTGKRYTETLTQGLHSLCISDKLFEYQCELYKEAKKKEDQNDDLSGEDNDDGAGAQGSIPKPIQLKIYIIGFDPKFKDIDDCLKASDDPEKTFRELMDRATRYLPPIQTELQKYRKWNRLLKRKAQATRLGEIVSDHFLSIGQFYLEGEKTVRLRINGSIYEIGSNIPFKALFYQTTGIAYNEPEAKTIVEVILANAAQKGIRTDTASWIHTDRKRQRIYFNLANEANEILQLEPNSISIIPNGANADKVLLQSTPTMKPINYIPEMSIRDGMELYWKKAFNNFSCSESNRYLITSQIIATLLIEYTTARGITLFSGVQGSAKSAGARIISILILGSDCVSSGTLAARQSEAAKSPVLLIDNVESRDRSTSFDSFLLRAGTGAINMKRDTNTNSENVYERLLAQIILTAIETPTKSELVSRIIDIQFGREFRNLDFEGESKLIHALEEARDSIWSAFFKMVAHDILPYYEDEHKSAYTSLKTNYEGHSKERLNEFIALLFIICREVVKYIPHSIHTGPNQAWQILDDWLREQEQLANTNQRGSDPILYRLEALSREGLRLKEKEFRAEYGIKLTLHTPYPGADVTQIEMLASTKDLCMAFSMLTRNTGIQNPFGDDAQVLASRINNSTPLLEREGWEIEKEASIIKGSRKTRWTRKMN